MKKFIVLLLLVAMFFATAIMFFRLAMVIDGGGSRLAAYAWACMGFAFVALVFCARRLDIYYSHAIRGPPRSDVERFLLTTADSKYTPGYKHTGLAICAS